MSTADPRPAAPDEEPFSIEHQGRTAYVQYHGADIIVLHVDGANIHVEHVWDSTGSDAGDLLADEPATIRIDEEN